ncbi:E3 ubiquitin-protein ligase PUB23-like [Oryza brachyantha]|uniref:E3 ubiquitin-protein ligase PUB23-like n=1 Tax=Oryza brachyantha TaxID=4533 RepID=UPI001ADD40D7|nr:E3 ubiquitin-protein ligase PUB23-like [Oryza brachyantha]
MAMESAGGLAPHHFMCPISLHPMQDPVTAPTGITYDRRAIHRWLAAGHASCPVTGHPLSLADLTPNHTLRRLIDSWSSSQLPPGAQLTAAAMAATLPADVAGVVEKVMAAAAEGGGGRGPSCGLLREAAAVASESGAARRCMVQAAGVLRRVLRLAVSCAEKSCCSSSSGEARVSAMETFDACLALFHALDVSADELRPLVADNHDLVDAVTRVLVALERGRRDEAADATRASAVQLLECVTEAADASLLERLRPEFFAAVTAVVRDRVSPGAARAALRTLLHACASSGRNRALVVDAGAAHEAIELELDAWSPQAPGGRRATELVVALLAQLCACADGRSAVASHPAGIAVVAKRVLRVSAAADVCAVRVLAAVGGRAASPEVLREMARVGAVGKLCCVLQADCDASVKETARAVLRMHSGVWSGSPCVSAYLLSRYL